MSSTSWNGNRSHYLENYSQSYITYVKRKQKKTKQYDNHGNNEVDSTLASRVVT